MGLALQRDGDPKLGGLVLDPCIGTCGPGAHLSSATDKFADVTDPPLHLAAGTWHIQAYFSGFIGTTCGQDQNDHNLRAETTIVVTEP